MAKILEFKRRIVNKEAERYKALAKNNIRTFSCKSCGEVIEVINGQYPDKCPGCGLKITNWKRAEEQI